MRVQLHKLFTLMIASLLINDIALAAGRMRSLEDAIETSSSLVTLPSSDAGSLYFRNCASCNENPLRFSKASKVFLGRDEVSLQSLNKEITDGREHFIMVFYRPDERLVTRIVVRP